MKTYTNEEMEAAREAGKRELFLKMQAANEAARYADVRARHAERVKRAKEDYPVASYIEGLGRVEKITEGCGTQRGWVLVHFAGAEKGIEPRDIRAVIAARIAEKRVREAYDAIKYPKTAHGGVTLPGTYDEAIDQLLTRLELKNIWGLQEWDENNIDSFSESYNYAYKEAIKDGYTDAEAEEKGQEAEGEARSDEYKKYKDALEEVINRALSYAGIELLPAEKNGTYRIAPVETWKEAADKMAEVITGYGTFQYNSGKELKDGGPYATYAEAVLAHLHWLKHGPEIYGDRRLEIRN
jgi:hypothetical protein